MDLLVLGPDAKPDVRTTQVRSWHDGNGFKPYSTKEAWLARAAFIREQVLVAAGLWPMPERCPMEPVIHGRIERESYTVEKVYFQSLPGFYVSGNLYRPKGKSGLLPGVISPHGHWPDNGLKQADGRLVRVADEKVEKELSGGFEKDLAAARSPLQARCANMARLGCVVFHYDMIGYGDAYREGFPHWETYADTRAHLDGLSLLGLQIWDSMRALDFILSLPEVDPGAHRLHRMQWGGTQTFLLMATDDRLKFAAPVCMISAGEHQGGCLCENAPLLRIDTDNVELTATYAPRPFIHPTATGDWTAEFMEKGFPEIRATYALFGAASKAEAVRYTAGHNYNLKSREAVYNFLNVQLRLGHPAPVVEQRFEWIDPKDLSVFDKQHPRPANSLDAAGLQKQWEADAARRMASLQPTDAASLQKYRGMVAPALRHMAASSLPAKQDVTVESAGVVREPGFTFEKLLLSRRGESTRLPALLFVPPKPTGAATVVVLPQGKAGLLDAKGQPAALLAGLLAAGQKVLAPDLFLIGEMQTDAKALIQADPELCVSGFNRMTLANRVHDILTAVACLRRHANVERVNLVGQSRAGVWCLLARALAGDAVARTAADADGFDFDQVRSNADEEYLPCSLLYGGLGPLAGLAAPGELAVYHAGRETQAWLRSAYHAAGAEKNLRIADDLQTPALVGWLVA